MKFPCINRGEVGRLWRELRINYFFSAEERLCRLFRSAVQKRLLVSYIFNSFEVCNLVRQWMGNEK